jgi:hypothetical protein
MYSILDDMGDLFARYYTHAGAEEDGREPAARPRRRRVQELVARFIRAGRQQVRPVETPRG